jgi:hypothetical protein
MVRRCLLAPVLLLIPLLLWSQSQNSSISGTITDASGAVVPNADLTLTSLARQVSVQSKSGADGLYSFSNLEPGSYELKVTATGFKPIAQRGITVNVNQLVRFDVRLEVGTDVQTVNVIEASASQLNFENATRAEGVTPETINELPLIVAGGPRNSAQFLVLLPGVTTAGGNSAYDARINGGMTTGDEAIMDGASMQEGFMSQSGMVSFYDFRMTPDMISEFRVLTSTYEPEYGASTGGQLIATTKSGTSSFHGGAFEYLRNKELNATQWQIDRPPGDARGKDNEHEFGGFIGGPVKIPKIYNTDRARTFFFTDIEFFRQRGAANVPTLTVPTEAERNGDFRDWGTTIYDPLTTRLNPNFNSNADISASNPKYLRDPISCNGVVNVICPDRFSAAAQGFLKFLPMPNKSGVTSNYLPPTGIPDGILGDANHYLIKIDQYFGTKDHIAATIWRQMTPAKFLSLLPLQIATESFSDPQNSWVNRLNYDHTFSPTILNHMAFGYLNRNEGYGSVNYTYADQLPQIAGVPSHAYPPAVSFSNGYTSMGNSTGLNTDGVTTRPTYVFNDMVTWVKGRHTLKFGFEYRAIQGNAHNHGNESGSFYFDAGQTGLPTATGSGNAMASFLLGAVNNSSVNLISVRGSYIRQKAFIWHAGDTWKVTNKLSVNYGLRWDNFTPSWEKYDNMSFFDFGANPGAGGRPGRLAFAGSKWGDASAGVSYPEDNWHNGFGPRLGIAYAMNDKTVIRTGYGIFYTQAFYPGWGGGVSQAGLNISPTINTTGLGGLDPAFYWDQGFPIDRVPTPPVVDPSYENGQGGPNYRPKDANRLSYSQQWNFTIERQIGQNAMFSVAYVGNKGTRLPSQLLPLNVLNPSLLQTMGAAKLKDQFGPTDTVVDGVPVPYAGWYDQLHNYGCTPSVAQALVPYPQYCGGLTGLNENLGSSTYHAFQLKVEKRYSSGLYTLLSYSHSKLLTSAAGLTQSTSATWNGTTGAVISPFEMQRNKSLAPDDVPNSFSLAVVYELPVGKGKKWLNSGGFTNYVLGGWEVTSTIKYSSGTPFWFRANNCGVPGQFQLGCLPAVLPGQDPFAVPLDQYDPGGKKPLFNPAAFESSSLFTSGQYYGVGPRISGFRGFPFHNVDIGIGKRISIAEKVRLLIRAEAFNAFNLHNFTCTGNGGCQAFNTTLGDVNFGQWGGNVTTPRNIQLVGRVEF